MNHTRKIRIGTRRSPLALAQAHETQTQLIEHHPSLRQEEDLNIVTISTKGDHFLHLNLSIVGGKGLFTKEIDQALLNEYIDIAVHSMKDVPTILPEGLKLACVLPRQDPRDGIICTYVNHIQDLPAHTIIGTSSLRRQAQIRHHYPHLNLIPFRGNIQTRLNKLKSQQAHATILAMAGLKRLHLDHLVTHPLETNFMIPAVGQGAIGLITRRDDPYIEEVIAPLNHPQTQWCVEMERTFLNELDGSCRTPIAAYAKIENQDQFAFTGCVVRPDGSGMLKVKNNGKKIDLTQAQKLGRESAREIKPSITKDYYQHKE